MKGTMKIILTILALSAALAFTIPEGAENVKHSFDKNGNEQVSYKINKIAVAGIKINIKRASFESVSGDSVSGEPMSGEPH